jgi:hypothetical protein
VPGASERVSEWGGASGRNRSGLCDSVEVAGGAFLHACVHGVEVGPHGGGGVGVVEDLLNVEEVEVVGSVFVGGAVEDACGAAAEVVGAEVSEACGVGADADDALHACNRRDPITPGDVASSAAGLLPADDRVRRVERSAEFVGVFAEVGPEQSLELVAGDDSS